MRKSVKKLETFYPLSDDLKKLDDIRRGHGISYERLARALGVSISIVFKWLQGKSRPSYMAQKIVRRYVARMGRERK